MKHLFSRTQVIGILVLFGAIVLAGVLLHFLPKWLVGREDDADLSVETTVKEQFEQSLEEKHKVYQVVYRDTVALDLHFFDPNEEDSIGFLKLGLRPWMAHNALQYRRKGGRFRSKEKFRNLYGMDDELYCKLEPYIDIKATDTLSVDTFRYQYIQKKDTILELNSADTTELQYIRQIGRYTAIQIVRYRERLGGYSRVEQLREISQLNGVSAEWLEQFWVETDSIRPLRVNYEKPERMGRHPYLSFEQAEQIYDLRRKKMNNLQSVKDLQDAGILSEESLRKLEPYLSFEARKR